MFPLSFRPLGEISSFPSLGKLGITEEEISPKGRNDNLVLDLRGEGIVTVLRLDEFVEGTAGEWCGLLLIGRYGRDVAGDESGILTRDDASPRGGRYGQFLAILANRL